MLLFTPDWISHSTDKNKQTPIYSIAVHPDGEILATGGQDYKIKLWNIPAILDDHQDKLLSTLVSHNGAVLCCRWSRDGNYLASGSDDTKVVIWKRDESNYKVFGEQNVIGYRAIKICQGHQSDVVDLGWSPTNLLASCGLDSKILIWDENFDLLHTISNHQAFVKGVTWDPAGVFLASQSDDKTVKIFRTSDWELVQEITANFTETASTTFFRRLSWSPNGSTIVCANGESASICVAPIIDRKDWSSNQSLVGHQAPIEVAMFNPFVFKRKNANGDLEDATICAIGSQDQGISIWATNQAHAITSIQHVFHHSVLDLAWSADGQTLFACSYDGTVMCISFQQAELGKKMDDIDFSHIDLVEKHAVAESVKQLQMEKTYLDQSGKLLDRMDEGLDSSIGFQPVVKKPTPKPKIVASEATKENVDISKTPVKQQQVITVTKDGKKRIQPVFLTSPQSKKVEHQVDPQPNATCEPTNYILPVVTDTSKPTFLKLPALRNTFSLEIPVEDTETFWTLECKNTGSKSRISLSKDTEQLWVGNYSANGLLATMTQLFFSISFSDNTLCIYSMSGRKLFPPMKLSGIAYLVSSNQYLMALDCRGNLYTWDIERFECTLSTRVLFQEIEAVKITPEGVPLITTDKETWMYHSKMSTWMLVQQKHQGRQLLTLEQIEDFLVSSLVLNSGKDYQHYLRLYARKLCDESQISKTMELCYDLTGINRKNWKDEIAGYPKKELFKEILPILLKNRAFQRILDSCLEHIKE